MKQPIQWAIGTHAGRSEAANGAKLVNLFVEALPPDSKTPVVLYGTPGTEEFMELPTAPVLGLVRFEGKLYAVTSSNFYRIDSSGVFTQLGSVKIHKRVSFALSHSHIVFVGDYKGYHYSVAGGLQEFSGTGWYPPDTVTYQDGYFIFNKAGTKQFFISNLLAVTFNVLMYASAESKPDNLVAVVSDHSELWLFGERSIEVWYNSGDVDFPFARIAGASLEIGIAGPLAKTQVDNSIFWLGSDGVFYRAHGYQAVRISTHAVEYDILLSGSLTDVFAYSYKHEGHTFIVLTNPGQNKTWCYDASTGEWHERSHINMGRHHSNCYVNCYEHHLVGDYQSGKIYKMEMDILTDDSLEIRRVAVSPPLHTNRRWAIVRCLEIDMESGISPGDEDVPIMLRYSDDGGKTWSNEKWAGIGKVGEYLTRVQWRRLGRFRQRQFEISISGAIPVVILGAYAEIEDARH